MCAIIGFKVDENNHHTKLKDYLEILKERGDQSYGYIAKVPDGTIYYSKSLTLEPILKDVREYEKGTWVFIHARKASAGMAGATAKDKLARAHPVVSDDESILLIHNGTKTSLHDTVNNSLSDSQAFATLLSVAWKGRYVYSGDIGVSIYERSGVVYLYKDDIRPLVMCEDGTIFASEPVFDTKKWCNVKDTYNLTGNSDTVLDFSKENLGLNLGVPVEIEFDIAVTTIKNFSTAGQPKASYCTKCKKTHLNNSKTYCCAVCAIEGNVTTKTYTAATKKNYHSTTTNTSKSKLPPGVIFKSNNRVPTKFDSVLYTCDTALIRRLDISGGSWAGTAIIKVDKLIVTKEGLIFAKPSVNGKHFIKADILHIPAANMKVRNAFSKDLKAYINIIGDLDDAKIIDVTEGIDISKSFGVKGTNTVLSTTVRHSEYHFNKIKRG